MNGSKILSDEEKQEMLSDANNKSRGRAFLSARQLSHIGTLDDYIDFLSENMALVPKEPVQRKTSGNKL